MLLNVISTYPWLFVAYAFMLGAVIGSFVNAAIYRLPRNISMLKRTRSFCPKCEGQIAWYDNIPILSYLLLLGRCRGCKTRIPLRYLIVEGLVSSLFMAIAYQYLILNRPSAPSAPNAMPWILVLVQLFLVANLTCIAFTDLETWLIPFPTTYPWIGVGLALAPVFPELHPAATPWMNAPRWDALIDAFQGVVIGGGCLWAIGFACIVLIGKPGMGPGDSHLVAMIGALLGWKAAVTTILFGVFIGSFVGIGSILLDRFNQWRLKEGWKPRRAAFEMGEGEEDLEPPPSWPLLVMGLIVIAFESAVLTAHAPRYLEYWWEKPFLSAVVGLLIGAFLLLAYPIQRKLIADGQWPVGDIEENEDGKKEEVLEGNYIPFGPSLALAGLIVIFYDPLIRVFAWWWFFGVWTGLPYKLLFLG